MEGTGRPVWDDALSAEDAAALDPGAPSDLPPTPDVLVIGGGQIGLATGAACRRAGLGSVLLVERGRLAAGPSGRNGGFLVPAAHSNWGDAWLDLAQGSLELHRELDDRNACGLRMLDLHIVPDVVLEDQAHVDPLRVAAAYTREAGTVATRVEATSTDMVGEGVVRVHTSHGTITPGAVVFATGSAPAECGELRQGFVKGHMVATEPAGFTLDRMIVTLGVGIAQLADGRLICGGTEDYGDDDLEVADAPIATLRDAIKSAVPEAEPLEITHKWCCFRPHNDDDLPVVDRLPGTDNAWVVSGLFKTGVLMAPVIGELVAEWIGSGSQPAATEAFALSRVAVGA